ncbi:MAG: 4'-phosphopantetheinyl transferase superfamily protein [Synergistaceae bacterium]|nr:4'-phosphopantetheinyl transferase superfamily protein [Synergistaceae bacterium]
MLKILNFLDTEIYILNIARRLGRPVNHKYLKLFSPERQQKILNYKFNPDRNRTLYAELLARKIIARKLNVNFNKIIINRDASGRPFIDNKYNLHFSLSHSGNYIALSIGTRPNGVDIETRANIDLNIAKRFFLEHEYKYILNHQNSQQEFLKIWTLKESCLKCLNLNNWSSVDTFKLLNSDANLKAANFILPDAICGVCVQNN